MSEAVETTPIHSMVEPFELEVSKGSFQLKVKGFKPLAQVTQYVADFVGIVGEPVGTLTDTLRNYRIHRAESAAAAMLRAKQIAAEQGRRLPAVSPKMLSPWIEGASSEDLSSENILELWARLLASATAEFDPVLLAFIEICKKIGPREAKTLSSLININCFSGISCSIEGVEGGSSRLTRKRKQTSDTWIVWSRNCPMTLKFFHQMRLRFHACHCCKKANVRKSRQCELNQWKCWKELWWRRGINGRLARVTATACRNTSTCRTSVSAPRSTRLTVKKTQAPGTLGRTYADMPASMTRCG